MDDLSFLKENGMPNEEIQRLMNQGLTLKEIAAAARRLVDSGRPLTEPQEAVKEVLPDFFDDKGHFLHNILGDYLTETYGCCKINGAVHIYDNGIYRPGEDALHGAMVDLLPSLSNAKRRETFQYIKVCRRTPVKELSPPNLIPFRHRVYDLKTGEFLDYSKDLVFLNRFPWDYDPELRLFGVNDDHFATAVISSLLQNLEQQTDDARGLAGAGLTCNQDGPG